MSSLGLSVVMGEISPSSTNPIVTPFFLSLRDLLWGETRCHFFPLRLFAPVLWDLFLAASVLRSTAIMFFLSYPMHLLPNWFSVDDPIAGDTELKGTAWLALPLQMYPNPHRPYSNLPNNIFTHLTTIVSANSIGTKFRSPKTFKISKISPRYQWCRFFSSFFRDN